MARGGREKRCVLRSQQSARIRDRSDHHRCLYCGYPYDAASFREVWLAFGGCLVLLGDNIPCLRAPSEDAVFDVATGVWDWQSHEGFCKDNPHTVAFTPGRKVMVITGPRPWSDTAAADDRVAVYDISEHTASYIRGHLRDETRTTASGKDVV